MRDKRSAREIVGEEVWAQWQNTLKRAVEMKYGKPDKPPKGPRVARPKVGEIWARESQQRVWYEVMSVTKHTVGDEQHVIAVAIRYGDKPSKATFNHLDIQEGRWKRIHSLGSKPHFLSKNPSSNEKDFE